MEKKTIRIYKEADVEIDLEKIIKQLNQTSEYIEFTKGTNEFSIEPKILT